MEYPLDLVSAALKSKGEKIFILADGHEMKIMPLDDGKTMDIIIDDGASYKTKGAKNFVKIIGQILESRGIAGWDETREGQDRIDQVLSMYKNELNDAS
ncbi:hypothetical protein [Desulfovibrio sp.]|uniref:hypothetical protein n=1 Tax=Desulfovibrio TaxID=872 RepID=UPI0025BB8E91|nr:hypothetical protein [Desulfovibrio sp.]